MKSRSDDAPQPLWRVLQSVGRASDTVPTWSQVVDRLGPHSLVLLIAVIALPSTLPLPPGLPMFIGFLIGLLAVQMITGRDCVWLPQWIARSTRGTAPLLRGLSKQFETEPRWAHLIRPRIPYFTTQPSYRMAGVIMVILGIVMMLPIPIIGNIPPALTIVILCLGFLASDGLCIAIGFISAVLVFALSFSAFLITWQFLS